MKWMVELWGVGWMSMLKYRKMDKIETLFKCNELKDNVNERMINLYRSTFLVRL